MPAITSRSLSPAPAKQFSRDSDPLKPPRCRRGFSRARRRANLFDRPPQLCGASGSPPERFSSRSCSRAPRSGKCAASPLPAQTGCPGRRPGPGEEPRPRSQPASFPARCAAPHIPVGAPVRRIRRGQSFAVDFPVGSQRHRVHAHHRRRQHVVRQLAGQRLPHSSDGECLLVARHVRDQPLVSGNVFANNHDRLANSRIARKRGLDFSKLDAESA